ncbi:MAG: hypothetical protein AB7H85_03605 [Dehalococcoidia bacterium]
MSASNPAVVSLAILKVNHDRLHRDYLQNFVPLVLESLAQTRPPVVSSPDLQADLRTRFGLQLPQYVLDALVQRLEQAGALRYEDGAFRPTPDLMADPNFAANRSALLAQHDSVVAQLKRFVHREFGVNWTEDDAEASLLAYLDANHFEILSGAYQSNLFERIPTANANGPLFVGSFILDAYEHHRRLFDFVENVTVGLMLARAVFLETSPTDSAALPFASTSFYLDSMLLLMVLDCLGPSYREPCEELLNLLRSGGAQLRCFEHTIDEIKGILQSAAISLQQDAVGNNDSGRLAISEYYRKTGRTSSDVLLLSNRIRDKLDYLTVTVVPSPTYDENTHANVIDESLLEAKIKAHLRYNNPLARDRDVRSISSVMLLRDGHVCRSIEDCVAIFVTTNTKLSRICYDFFHESHAVSEMSPCISDSLLTMMAWLKTPNASPSLPRKRLIADCYAATQPGEELRHAYIEEIQKLSADGNLSQDDYLLLRFEATSDLMAVTFGEPAKFGRGTVPEVLEHAKRRMRSDLLERLGEETAAGDALRAREEHRNERLAAKANLYAHRTVWLVLALLTVGLVAASLSVHFGWLSDMPVAARWAVTVPTAAVAVLGVLSAMYGWTVAGFGRDRAESMLAVRFERRLRSLAEDDASADGP